MDWQFITRKDTEETYEIVLPLLRMLYGGDHVN